MFVMGGHPEIDLGRTRYVFNPEVLEMSKETVMLKEVVYLFLCLLYLLDDLNGCK